VSNQPSLLKELRESPLIKAIYQISQQMETPIYIVGGAVRDLLMGALPEQDFDFVMQKNLDQVARLFSKMVGGHLIRWSVNPVNYRVISYQNNARREIDFSEFRGNDLYEDLTNRDFTVNAIALRVDEFYDKEEPRFYDPLEGRDDIRTRTLRLASPLSFYQDPLRMLRAVRIPKAKHFTIDPHTRAEIYRHRHLLSNVSAERVRSEFFKTIGLPGAQDSISDLDNLGLLSILFPELAMLRSEKLADYPSMSPWTRCLQTVRWCEWALDNLGALFAQAGEQLKAHFSSEIEEDVSRASLLKLAGLLFPFEQSACREQDAAIVSSEERGKANPTFADTITKRFKLGRKASRILKTVPVACSRVDRISRRDTIQDRVYFRYFWDTGHEGLDALMLFLAVSIARKPDRFGGAHDTALSAFLLQFIRYYVDEFTATFPQPLISGKEIMEIFCLKEGRSVGALLRTVADAESEGLLSSREEALEYIDNLVREEKKFCNSCSGEDKDEFRSKNQ
jgi:poly(A) polymerase